MISLGIDIGTTSICAVLYDLTEDKIIRSVSAPNSFVNTGSYLQDPDRIVSVVKELYKELMMELKLWTGEHETRKDMTLGRSGNIQSDAWYFVYRQYGESGNPALHLEK